MDPSSFSGHAPARKRPRDSYLRWERDEPMALWQMDIVGGMFLADGTEAKVVTGVDDHSHYCVIASVVASATGRAVCLALVAALRARPARTSATSAPCSPRGDLRRAGVVSIGVTDVASEAGLATANRLAVAAFAS